MFSPATLPIVFALSSCSTLMRASSAGLWKLATSPAANTAGWLVRHSSSTTMPLSTRRPACSANSTLGWMPRPATTASALTSRWVVVRITAGPLPRVKPVTPFADVHHDALLAVVVHEERGEIGGIDARAEPCFGNDHGHVAALHPQSRGDLAADEPATEHGEPHGLIGEGAEPPVVCQSAEVDDVRRFERQLARRTAGREQQPIESIGGAAIVGDLVPFEIERHNPPPQMYGHTGRRRVSPDRVFGIPFQRPLERGGRLYGGSSSAPITPTVAVASTARSARAAASAVMPPPTIR